MRIGFFDSGIGGVSVAKTFIKNNPSFSYLYFADDAHMPYGERSPDEVFVFTTRALTRMFKHSCTLVILACNSASTVLPRIQQEWLPAHFPDKKVLGIIRPTAEDIAMHAHEHEVYILATPITVASRAYDKELAKINQVAHYFEIACPKLAEAIEKSENYLSDAQVSHYCKLYTQPIPPSKSVYVYTACTHYAWAAQLLQQERPLAKLIHQSSIIADTLSAYLSRHTEISQALIQTAELSFEVQCSSEDKQYIQKLQNLFTI